MANSEIRDYLGVQQWRLNYPITMVEIFSGEIANLSKLEEKVYGGNSLRFGLAWGHDLIYGKGRRIISYLVARCGPRDVFMAWPCKYLSSWSRYNMRYGPLHIFWHPVAQS